MLGWNEDIKKELGFCGEQVFIGHNVMFANPKRVYLDDRVRIDPFCFITTGLETGNNVQICAYAMLGGGAEHTILLRNWTFVGYGSKLFCASEDYRGDLGPVNEFWGWNEIRRGDIEFMSYSGVASDVMVFPGVTLPTGCTIGAKSLVHNNKYLNPWTVHMGEKQSTRWPRDRDTILKAASDPEYLKEK